MKKLLLPLRNLAKNKIKEKNILVSLFAFNFTIATEAYSIDREFSFNEIPMVLLKWLSLHFSLKTVNLWFLDELNFLFGKILQFEFL